MLQTNSKSPNKTFIGNIPSLTPKTEAVAEQQPQPAAAEVEIISDANDIKISNSDFIGHIFSDLPKTLTPRFVPSQAIQLKMDGVRKERIFIPTNWHRPITII